MKKTLCLKYRQTFKTTEFILKERKSRYQTRIFSVKKISSPSKWCENVEWKWMQRHTSDIYRKNFYVPSNAFINKNWVFVQDNALSHRSNLVQDFLQEILNSYFIKTHEWPPSSPDCSSQDYFFWNKGKEKVNENRLNKLVENKRDVKKWIKSIWKDIAFSLPEIWGAIKQFAGRLKSFKEREGPCLKIIYG